MLPGVTIVDVLDTRREHDGIIFVPAFLDFDDHSTIAKIKVFDRGMRKDARYRTAVKHCGVDDEFYSFPSIWLRSRILAEFRMRPPFSEGDNGGGLLEVPFLAAVRGTDGHLDVHPFVCGDAEDGGEPRLEFARSCSPPQVQSTIAAAFRALMLADPLTLSTFDAWCVRDSDDDWGWAWCGIDRAGTAYEIALIDSDPEDGPPDPIDPHLTPPDFLGHGCEGCGGTGEESFFPAGEPCELCGGTGRLDWVETWPFSGKRPRRFASRIFNRRS